MIRNKNMQAKKRLLTMDMNINASSFSKTSKVKPSILSKELNKTGLKRDGRYEINHEIIYRVKLLPLKEN